MSKEAVQLLKEVEAAKMLATSPGTLRYWRCVGVGPDYVRLNGTRIRYDVAALLRFIEQGRHSVSMRAAGDMNVAL